MKRKILRAMELIYSGVEEHSCLAVNLADTGTLFNDSPLKDKYAEFYGEDAYCPGDYRTSGYWDIDGTNQGRYAKNNQLAKGHRLTLLALFLAAEGEL